MTSGQRVSDLVAAGVLRVEDGNHGEYRPRPHEFVDHGVPFIRAADMSSGVISFASAGKINVIARKRIRKGIGQPGDILLSHKGTVGKVAVAPMDSPDFVCSPQTTFWRSLDLGLLDQGYLRYVLLSDPFERQLSLLKGQTDMAPYVSLTDQRSMTVPIPPIGKQRAIAEVLGALDDKIAANAVLVAKAEELRRALFSAMLETAEMLPLSGLAQFVNGKAFTKDASGTGRVVIRIAELNSGLGGSTVYNDIEVPDQHVARPGDILFAWSGSLTLHRWFRPDGIVNQHIFKVIPNDGRPRWCIYELIARKLEEFKGIAADKATTMGHIQRRHLDECVPVPSQAQIDRHHVLMTALWDRTLMAEQEILKLSELRDVLLPQLMSGRIRVKDVQARVGEVL